MSNYIFNDSFSGGEGQALSTVAKKNKWQLQKILLICTVLIATAMIILTLLLAFTAISGLIDKSGAPRVTNNTAYVSNDDGKKATVNGASAQDAFSTMKNSVVSITTKTGAKGSGVIAGEFDDSNGKHGYYVVTCASVINNQRSGLPALISDITLENGDKYEAQLCGSDSTSNIAVLRIYESKGVITVARWASMEASQPSGIIIMGDAGGGVFNLSGELIGISTDGKVEKINYIPSSVAFSAYESLTIAQYQRKLK